MTVSDDKNGGISQEFAAKLTKDYCEIVRAGVDERWAGFELNLLETDLHEVVGGLLARQANITTNFACNPGIWNPHITPLIYRSQVDGYITLAWILEGEAPEDKARNFILYGLGQEKLQVEHLKNYCKENPNDEQAKRFLNNRQEWINSQMRDFLLNVDLGSWSGLTTRQMAEQANCLDLYNYAYSPFSAGAHNMWSHLARHDLRVCRNPLHKGHRTPNISNIDDHDISFYDLIISAKYVQKSFYLVDQKFTLKPSTIAPMEFLLSELGKIK